MAEFDGGWATVELMGHVTMFGRLSEVVAFGTTLGRCDVPVGHETDGEFVSRYFGGSSVYRITPVSEETAKVMLEKTKPKAVVYQLELGERFRDDDDYDPDYGGDEPDDDEDETLHELGF